MLNQKFNAAGFSFGKLKWLAVGVFVFILGFTPFNPFSINDSGYRNHVQKFLGGEKIQFESGMYWSGVLSKRTIYPDVITIQYSVNEPKEEVTVWEQPFEIRFSDATKADAQATVRWRLPSNESDMLKIHKEYRSPKKLAEVALNKYTRECLKYSAQLMESETHYSGGMSALSEDFQFQLANGQYIIDYKTEYVIDTVTNEKQRLTRTYERTDPVTGKPVLNTSDIQQFNIVPTTATVDQIDYEEQVDKKLAEKIESSTRESISKQKLITAQQEALTAIEEGKKKIEETRATELAAKEEAVIRAQKDKEVEREKSEQAKFTALKIKAEKEAEAIGNQQLRAAGLTPQEEAEWNYKTQVDVAKALSGVQFPSLMVIGGGDKNGNGATNPFDAVGLKALMDIQKEMSKD